MPVTIRLTKATIATLEHGEWETPPGPIGDILQKRLDNFSIDDIDSVNYTPWPDYTLAQMAVKALGGKIIKATDPPEYVAGRVY